MCTANKTSIRISIRSQFFSIRKSYHLQQNASQFVCVLRSVHFSCATFFFKFLNGIIFSFLLIHCRLLHLIPVSRALCYCYSLFTLSAFFLSFVGPLHGNLHAHDANCCFVCASAVAAAVIVVDCRNQIFIVCMRSVGLYLFRPLPLSRAAASTVLYSHQIKTTQATFQAL